MPHYRSKQMNTPKKNKLPGFVYVIGAFVALGIYSANHSTSSQSTSAEATSSSHEFQVGDVVDVDAAGIYVDSPEWPGGLECWNKGREGSARDNLIRSIRIMRETKLWKGVSAMECGRLDETY